MRQVGESASRKGGKHTVGSVSLLDMQAVAARKRSRPREQHGTGTSSCQQCRCCCPGQVPTMTASTSWAISRVSYCFLLAGLLLFPTPLQLMHAQQQQADAAHEVSSSSARVLHTRC